ncbi:nicotinate-nucleotide--dimethylbenzimidazole phosphoribosyltransferase [Methylophilus sp. QUAN]|uniref:nicotinate-nucleotide--dimethylbenzimidazole phosphoribosyltransferase n=1 Tax=Methylophilus sp. QUAN TaxID=2781020 RepID=UPI00188E0453|nr:nicotinate-nucleotide--dimethylbenzimidazole phosphoribosyltransferase [Methylophilus sp. QUAN]MBF4989826.1 nicotinate-nucleotide--dimethylbenzimidazole phosphoribosyltransferase [Methylophilus sp. QUAN]
MQTFHIEPTHDALLQAALVNQINQKTKPLGALGRLETLALQLGLVQQTERPVLQQPTMLVFAGDHGIVEEGVSPYPQAVTAQMVLNFLNGGAAINVFARQHGFDLHVVDSGVNAVFQPHPLLIDAKIGMGTENFRHHPAMTADQCTQAITRGAQIARNAIAQGCNVMALGEMGIGNTSSASCLMSVLCDLPMHQCVGRGTGLSDKGLQHKLSVLTSALQMHHVAADEPLQALAAFGGFEIAMMVGALLAAAEARTTLLIDGFIATSALLVAAKLYPQVIDYCVFAHCSDESGHSMMLSHLKAQPLLHLSLRLGEGTGAVLAYPLLQSAVAFLNEMASFESAGVSGQLQ